MPGETTASALTLHWTVPTEHPAFPGHFPGRPILPGVVLLDRAITAAAQHYGLAPEALRIAAAKFLSPVAPGESLVLTMQRTPTGSVQFAISGDARTIASGSLAVRPEDAA